MNKILVPIKSKIKPIEVDEEIKKFKKIHKSPYSQTYYDTDNISWEHKPEGSLRISDHWNFESKGKKHCELYNVNSYIENNWILAQYKEGKYHILKEFGEGIDGYIYKPLHKGEIETLKYLYDIGGIEKTYNFYKRYNVRPAFTREGYIKNVKKLNKYISIDRLRKFKSKKPKAKKIIFIEDMYLETLDKIFSIYEKSYELENLLKSNDTETFIKNYGAYELKAEREESLKEIYTLVIDKNIAIDFD